MNLANNKYVCVKNALTHSLQIYRIHNRTSNIINSNSFLKSLLLHNLVTLTEF